MVDRTRSEYGGGGVMPSTVFPKPEEALKNGERLRMMSLTGQETDTNAPLDAGFWYGNSNFDETKPLHTYKEHEALVKAAEVQDKTRYNMTPPTFG